MKTNTCSSKLNSKTGEMIFNWMDALCIPSHLGEKTWQKLWYWVFPTIHCSDTKEVSPNLENLQFAKNQARCYDGGTINIWVKMIYKSFISPQMTSWSQQVSIALWFSTALKIKVSPSLRKWTGGKNIMCDQGASFEGQLLSKYCCNTAVWITQHQPNEKWAMVGSYRLRTLWSQSWVKCEFVYNCFNYLWNIYPVNSYNPWCKTMKH